MCCLPHFLLPHHMQHSQQGNLLLWRYQEWCQGCRGEQGSPLVLASHQGMISQQDFQRFFHSFQAECYWFSINWVLISQCFLLHQSLAKNTMVKDIFWNIFPRNTKLTVPICFTNWPFQQRKIHRQGNTASDLSAVLYIKFRGRRVISLPWYLLTLSLGRKRQATQSYNSFAPVREKYPGKHALNWNLKV